MSAGIFIGTLIALVPLVDKRIQDLLFLFSLVTALTIAEPPAFAGSPHPVTGDPTNTAALQALLGPTAFQDLKIDQINASHTDAHNYIFAVSWKVPPPSDLYIDLSYGLDYYGQLTSCDAFQEVVAEVLSGKSLSLQFENESIDTDVAARDRHVFWQNLTLGGSDDDQSQFDTATDLAKISVTITMHTLKKIGFKNVLELYKSCGSDLSPVDSSPYVVRSQLNPHQPVEAQLLQLIAHP